MTASVLAGIVWAIRNPKEGVVESEDLPFNEILDIAGPYVEPVRGVYSDWTPLAFRQGLFPDPNLDKEDPFQFSNFRIF